MRVGGQGSLQMGGVYNQVTLNIARPPLQSGCDRTNNGYLTLNTELRSRSLPHNNRKICREFKNTERLKAAV